MAGDIYSKERSIVTLTSTGGSLTNGSAGAAGTDLDARASGNVAQDFRCAFELTCQWATVTGIAKDTVVAELYLLPKRDGTNLPDIDTTSGSSALPITCQRAVFVATKAPTSNTNARFVTGWMDLDPELYTAYILDRAGQTIAANWTLKVVSARGQYS